MSIENEIFNRTRIVPELLIQYGFRRDKNRFILEQDFMNDKFRTIIIVDEMGTVYGTVYDHATGEEFLPLRIAEMNKGFVGHIKNEYEQILIGIRTHCGTQNYFIGPQSNRLAAYIADKYGALPVFPWTKYPGFGVFKHQTNAKWFALLANINISKLDKTKSGEIEILNIKLEPASIKRLLRQNGFYSAYHMNKTCWITIILDDSVPDAIITDLIDQSYKLTINIKTA